MNREAYRDYLERLQARLEADPCVIGLVLAGSTASQSHQPDEWSDHDFFVVTEPGVQEQFRTVLDWLPDHEAIVLSLRETEHGLKVLYASGHLIEFAVFDLAEIGLAKLNDYAVVFDRGGVTEAARTVASSEREIPSEPTALRHEAGMFLCLLVVGAGRVARGEAISGQVFIRTYAVGRLLRALSAVLPATDPARLDNLDVYRRFEQVFPDAGAAINDALSQEPIGAALDLLAAYEQYLHGTVGDIPAAAATVRTFLERAAATPPVR